MKIQITSLSHILITKGAFIFNFFPPVIITDAFSIGLSSWVVTRGRAEPHEHRNLHQLNDESIDK